MKSFWLLELSNGWAGGQMRMNIVLRCSFLCWPRECNRVNLYFSHLLIGLQPCSVIIWDNTIVFLDTPVWAACKYSIFPICWIHILQTGAARRTSLWCRCSWARWAARPSATTDACSRATCRSRARCSWSRPTSATRASASRTRTTSRPGATRSGSPSSTSTASARSRAETRESRFPSPILVYTCA